MRILISILWGLLLVGPSSAWAESAEPNSPTTIPAGRPDQIEANAARLGPYGQTDLATLMACSKEVGIDPSSNPNDPELQKKILSCINAKSAK